MVFMRIFFRDNSNVWFEEPNKILKAKLWDKTHLCLMKIDSKNDYY